MTVITAEGFWIRLILSGLAWFLFDFALSPAAGFETVQCGNEFCGYGTQCSRGLCVCRVGFAKLMFETTARTHLLYCHESCTAENTTCPANSTCDGKMNSDNTYSCVCSAGYTRSATGHCLAVETCASKVEICGNHSRCVMSTGEVVCVCETGFTPRPDGKKGCIPVLTSQTTVTVASTNTSEKTKATPTALTPKTTETKVSAKTSVTTRTPPTAPTTKTTVTSESAKTSPTARTTYVDSTSIATVTTESAKSSPTTRTTHTVSTSKATVSTESAQSSSKIRTQPIVSSSTATVTTESTKTSPATRTIPTSSTHTQLDISTDVSGKTAGSYQPASIHLVIGLVVGLGSALLLSALLIVIGVIMWKRVKSQSTRSGSPSPETQGTVTTGGRNVREDYTTLNTAVISPGIAIYETISPGVVFSAKSKAPGDNDYVNIPNAEAAYYNIGNY